MLSPATVSFKQQLIAYFDGISLAYDSSEIHKKLAARLVASARLLPGQSVLDIATGTGWVALLAGVVVGPAGRVVGVDLSEAMLAQAQSKAVGLTNITFERADAEALDFPSASFDRVLCGAALAYLRDIPGALRRWCRLVRPGGLLAFTGFAESAMVNTLVLARVAGRYGVVLPPFNAATGTAERCRKLLDQAGCIDIEITTDDFSLRAQPSLADLQRSWEELLLNPWTLPLRTLPPERLALCQQDYIAAMQGLADHDGFITNNMQAHTATGHIAAR
jgi:ubiquinone/menaquinone biosynthesis C-methylase UbiE